MRREKEVDSFVRKESLREGARGFFATAPSAPPHKRPLK